VGKLSYLDLPLEVRKASAAKARAKYLEMLADVTISPEKSKAVSDMLTRIKKWETGTL
jgi:hypothetical protein